MHRKKREWEGEVAQFAKRFRIFCATYDLKMEPVAASLGIKVTTLRNLLDVERPCYDARAALSKYMDEYEKKHREES